MSISRETLLVYPNFSKLFVIHTDAIKVQFWTVISKDNKQIAFYSRKLNSVQVNYKPIYQELLFIVESNYEGAQKHFLRSANKSIY